jgi:hypothetical protein
MKGWAVTLNKSMRGERVSPGEKLFGHHEKSVDKKISLDVFISSEGVT